MLSKTSFFNLTLLRKNILRFCPIWIVYTVLWTVTQPLLLGMQLSQPENTWRPDFYEVTGIIGSQLTSIGPATACVYGVVLAMAVYSYLYTARSVSLMHALPIRRSGLFLTNYVSGLLFFLVPNLFVALATAVVTLVGGVFCPGMILTWFLCLSAMELFFYSFAVFVAMFTGHLLALPAFYAILNGLTAGLYFAMNAFVEPFLYGCTLEYAGQGFVMWMTPLIKMYEDECVTRHYDEVFDRGVATFSPEGVAVLAAYAAAGIVLTLLAYAVYSRHRSESAGDIVSVGWAKVLFRYGVALTAAFTLGQGLYYMIFAGSALRGTAVMLLCMIVVGALGFYVAQMLLNKSFRVLKKSLPGSAICAAIVLAVFAGAVFDVTGAVSRVPAADNVERVHVEISAYDYSDATLRTPESIERVRAIHSYAVENRNLIEADTMGYEGYYDGKNMHTWIYIDYTLKDGSTVSRRYNVVLHEEKLTEKGSLDAMVQELAASNEYRASDALDELMYEDTDVTILGGSFSYYEKGVYNVEQDRILSASEAETLRKALLEDAAAGRMPEIYVVDYPEDYDDTRYVNALHIEHRRGGDLGVRVLYLDLTANMTSTIAALENLGILNDYVTLRTAAEQAAGAPGAKDEPASEWGGEITADGETGEVIYPETTEAA